MSLATSAAPENLVEIPGDRLTLAEPAFKVNNHLADHPLFEPERIKQLLRTMPREYIEIRAVQQRETNDGGYKRGPMLRDVDPVDAFERLEEKPTWMLLHKSWWFDPEYRDLLEQYLEELAELCPEMQEGISRIGCWMFLSSGKSVVHFHSDDDQSFLNQIRGSKTVFVYPAGVLPASAIDELVYTENQGAVTYRPEYEARMFEPIHLEPGEAAFLPLFSPHRVVNDDGVSVSWNVGFHTRKSRAERNARYFNHELRRWGIAPRDVGQSAMLDWLKGQAHWGIRAKNKLLRTLRRGQCPQG